MRSGAVTVSLRWLRIGEAKACSAPPVLDQRLQSGEAEGLQTFNIEAVVGYVVSASAHSEMDSRLAIRKSLET